MSKDWARPFYISKEWRTLRKQILRRDLFTCADCGGRANEVHHIVELTPENIRNDHIRIGWDNLISLCGPCHKRRTKASMDVGDGYYFDQDGRVQRHPPR